MSGVDLDVGELRWQQRYGRVARELVEEHYIAGHLVAGEIVLHISLDDGLVVLSDRAEDNDRNAQLAPVHKSRLMRNCTEVETGGPGTRLETSVVASTQGRNWPTPPVWPATLRNSLAP